MIISAFFVVSLFRFKNFLIHFEPGFCSLKLVFMLFWITYCNTSSWKRNWNLVNHEIVFIKEVSNNIRENSGKIFSGISATPSGFKDCDCTISAYCLHYSVNWFMHSNKDINISPKPYFLTNLYSIIVFSSIKRLYYRRMHRI